MTQLSDFQRVNKYIQPPAYQGTYNRHILAGEDEARYILQPDAEFDRPWLASPQGKGGIAFVWPLGVEGFSFSGNATSGVHHFIGDNGVYVDIVYPDEFHIVLNGTFPGKTSAQQIPLLRQVILHNADAPGAKLLSVVPALASIEKVKVINHSFSHDQSDLTQAVQYSIEFIRESAGSLASSTTSELPDPNPSNSTLPTKTGKPTKKYVVKGKARRLAEIAKAIYGNSSMKTQLKIYVLNRKTFERLGIPQYKIPYALIPTGTVLYYS